MGSDQPTDDPDVDLDCEDLRDRDGNRVTFRIPDQLHRQAVGAAEREGKTVSALAREALERYLRQR